MILEVGKNGRENALSPPAQVHTHVHTHGQAQVTPLFLLQTFITKS